MRKRLQDLLKETIIFFIIIFSISFQVKLIGQVTYNVQGISFLEDHVSSGDHSGIKVKFYNLPSMEPEDSTFSNSDGTYSINISPGFYLVEWSKDGYVPQELGGYAVAGDSVISPVTLLPGEIKEVSGNVSGTWTKNFVYFVKDNVQVPASFSLTIKEGVRVKFDEGLSFSAYGKLKIEGTEDEPVIFTSLLPTPNPGAWGNLKLYAPSNSIEHLKYKWASNGITADGASNTTIKNLETDGTLKLGANGLYFQNCSDLSFKNNTIIATGDYGIFADGADNSEIISNKIDGPFNEAAIRLFNGLNCKIDSNNIIDEPKTGIYTNGLKNSSISYNYIFTNQNGISSRDGNSISFISNKIENYHSKGIDFHSSEDCVIDSNRIISRESNNNKYGIFNEDGNSNAIINNNYVYLWSNSYSSSYGIKADDSNIERDTVIFRADDDDNNHAIFANRSNIKHNYIESLIEYSNSDNSNGQSAIKSFGNTNTRSNIDNNHIKLKDNSNGLRVNYADVKNNKIESYDNYTRGDWAIISGDSCNITDNTIRNTRYGIRIKNRNVLNEISNNQIKVQDYGLYNYDAHANFIYNLIETSGRGIHIENQAGDNIINNTILGGGSNYGIYATNLSGPKIINNAVVNFNNGIYVDNNVKNYDIKHNDLYDISGNLFEGPALPPLIGQFIDENANRDPADIYNNINLKPQFADSAGGDYSLDISSPLVNAGDPDFKDPDSTVSDIGAYPFYLYVVVEHDAYQSTGNTENPYRIEAKVFSPTGSSVSADLKYSTDGENFNTIGMNESGDDTYYADIPAQPLNSTISYYIEATDGEHSVTSPFNIDQNVYSFYVTLFNTFSNLSASSQSDGKINLNWNTPTPTSGELTKLKLYKSRESNFNISEENLYKEFDPDTTGFLDNDVNEGVTYYYRLSGVLNDGTESLVSDEISVLSNDATIVRVTGTINLQGKEDNSGVKVFFEKVSPSAIEDSTFSNTSGAVNKVVHVGIYNIHFSKSGYQPVLIGNQFLSDNIDLDTVNMVPGGTVVLNGEVSDTLYNSNVYFVDGNVLVPEGNTLFIEPGTKIKFRGSYRFEVRGKIVAEGTELNPIVFTSGKPAPLEGDWDRIFLNGAPNSLLKYCEFYFASDGILLNNSDNTTIDNCVFDRHQLNSIALSDSTFDNNSNLTFTSNKIISKFSRGISVNNTQSSNFSNNDIKVTDIGIFARNSDSTNFSGNRIYPGKNSFLNSGIYSDYSTASIFNNNEINGFKKYGIIFHRSNNSILKYNAVADTNFQGNYPGNDNKKAIYNARNNQNCKIISNYITMNIHGHYNWGITCHESLIDSNSIELINADYQYRTRGIFSNRSEISNNYIFITNSDMDEYQRGYCIESNGNSEKHTQITNNEINSHYRSSGIKASYAKIEENKFIGLNNRLYGIEGGPNLIVKNNTFKNFQSGADINNGEDCIITNNEFNLKNGVGMNISGGSNTIVSKNIIKLQSGTGFNLDNGNASDLFQNTIVNLSSSQNGNGIYAYSNSTPIINSNLIYGFQNGIKAESNVYDIKFNLIYNCDNNFQGEGLPNQVGEVVTVNSNADPSDIYSNISLDPQFNPPADGDFQVTLKPSSPAINAGDIDSTDRDGTIADIGAVPYNYGYVPEDIKVDSTGNGYIALSWEINETDTLQGYKPYYKLSEEENWQVLSTINENTFKFENLNNNVSYDFTVSAVYNSSESYLPESISAKPGLANIIINPLNIITFQELGESTVKTIQISNQGNRDLDFWFTNANEHNLNIENGTVTPNNSITIEDTLFSPQEGLITKELIIKSTDYENELDTLYVLNAVSVPNGLASEHFNPVQPTENKFYFIVENANIDDDPFETGDEIALFSNDICVGAAKFNGQFPFIIEAYASNNKNGFTNGDSIELKLWDYSNFREANASMNVNLGSHVFEINGFAKVSIEGTIYKNITIPIEPNKFNLVSSYLMPSNNNIQSIFNTINGLKIVYQDDGSAYIPEYNLNSIDSYDLTEGYHLFTDDSTAAFNFRGKFINPQNYYLTLEAYKFNSISYLLEEPHPVSTVFQEVVDKIEIIQDDEGGVWIPSMNLNSIGNMAPFKGYQVYTNQTSNINFVFPEISDKILKSGKNLVKKDADHYSYEKTGIAYNIIINAAYIDGHEIEQGDEIAVFSGDLCVGATKWDTTQANYISAWKGDEDLGIAGYTAGKEISYKIYSKEYDTEFEAEANYSNENQKYFEKDAFSEVTITANPNIIPNEYALYQNYPNPFNPSTKIVYDVPKTADISIRIFNILGEKVRELVNSKMHKAGKYNIQWNGKNDYGRKVASGVYLIRLNSTDYKSTIKAILLK